MSLGPFHACSSSGPAHVLSDNEIWEQTRSRQLDEKNKRLASVLSPPGPLGPYHPAHRSRHMAETLLDSTSSPFLSLPAELHWEIFSHICAEDHVRDRGSTWLWTILALRGASRFFRHFLPPLTHMELLELETTLRATSKSLLACRYCLRLRPARRFSHTQVRQYAVSLETLFAETGMTFKSPKRRGKRFCADCGFVEAVGSRVELEKRRYQRGVEDMVGEEGRWVWCWWCDTLKKGKDAGELGKHTCRGSCTACCREHECKGACVVEEQERRRAIAQEAVVLDS